MKTSDFYYDLPKELIAQTPIEPRDASRLLVYNRKNNSIEHKHFYDITEYLRPGDLLVINNTKVIPARLFGKRENCEGKIEIFLLKRLDYTHWECLSKPARKLTVGTKVIFSDELFATVTMRGDDGMREVEFHFDGVFEDILTRVGNVPLPPYITEELKDANRYQTVYSKIDGSAAAPTAGLHFTPELMQKVKDMGVEVQEVLLHVGLGTFRPVKTDSVETHQMHSEYYEVSQQAADRINLAKREGRRVICVGTTSVRTVESAFRDGAVQAGSGNTSIFIYPGYHYNVVDGLITNFHLPESTLIMLVSAFMGKENTLSMYETAVKEKYRFFSFGDACLIL